MAIPGSIFSALKQAAPDKSDAELVSIWDEVKKLSPQVESMAPIDAAKIVMNVKNRLAAPAPAAAAAPTQPSQRVTIVGSNPYNPLNARPTVPESVDINPNLPSPYRGTAMMARSPQAPASSQVAQFDPEAMSAAYADYARRYAETAGQRQMGQRLAAAAGPEALTASRQSWADLDAQNKLMSLDRQTALQQQATAGLAAAGAAQDIDKVAGEYKLSKLKGAQELEKLRQGTTLGGIDVLQRQKLAKPGTAAARMAFLQLKEQADAAGRPLPKEINANTMSVEDMMPYMEPKLLKSWQDISAGRKASAEAGVTEAVSGAITAPGGQVAAPGPRAGTQVSPEVQNERDRERLKILQDELSKATKPADRAALQREILSVTKTMQPSEIQRRLPYASISAGGVTLSPTPQTMAGAESEGRAAAEAAQRFRTYDTELAPTLGALRAKLEKVGTGKGTEAIARLLPGNEQQELVNLLNRANAIYPGVVSAAMGSNMSRLVAEGGFNGSLVASMPTEQVQRMIGLIEQTARQDRAYQQRSNVEQQQPGAAPGQFGANQPVPTTTPPAKPKAPAGGLPRISNADQYNALPPGARFIDTRDNKTKEKP